MLANGAGHACQAEEGNPMDLIITLIVGGIVGWLASLLMRTSRQMGILANVLVGILGSALGFWVAGALGLAAYGTAARWLISIGGAMLLIAILKALGMMR
jgi:uncharacterized membrane protein YeaQ/YmgE (transglycosylase-associated protein family)